MHPYFDRSMLTVQFVMRDSGLVHVLALDHANRYREDRENHIELLSEHYQHEDLIRKVRHEMVSVLATWLHRQDVWSASAPTG